MKEEALKHFRQGKGYNCAQTVYYSQIKHGAVCEKTMEELGQAGGGRAPDGLCGALYAAKLHLPEERKIEIRTQFEEVGGSVRCRDIRKARKMSCHDCVAEAADFLEKNLGEKMDGK